MVTNLACFLRLRRVKQLQGKIRHGAPPTPAGSGGHGARCLSAPVTQPGHRRGQQVSFAAYESRTAKISIDRRRGGETQVDLIDRAFGELSDRLQRSEICIAK